MASEDRQAQAGEKTARPEDSHAGDGYDPDGQPREGRRSGGRRSAEKGGRQGRKGPRKPRKVTPDYLERAALHYLERFASSSANLRRVLQRRVLKSARYHGTDPAEAEPWIAALIERFQRSGLLDDGAYARARAASLFRRGDSRRSIRAKLSAKGIDGEEIDDALASLADEMPGPLPGAPGDDGTEPDAEQIEREAARTYARRRRIGPHRPADERAANRERDLAAMARAGFGYDIARDTIDAGEPD